MAADPLDVPRAAARLSRTRVLDEDVSRLNYVSGAREEALRRLGIERVEDLLQHVPLRYLDFTHVSTIEEAPVGEVATIVGTVDRVANKRARSRNLTVTEVYVMDETGVLQAAFFKQPWLARELSPGDRLALMGKVEFAYGFKQMSSPHMERLEGSAAAGSILPVHRVGEGISRAWMRRIVSEALKEAGHFADPLPAPIRARRGLMDLSRAYRAIQFPREMAEVGPARSRLAYDELLYLQLALRVRNDPDLLGVEPVAHVRGAHLAALRRALPFELTDEQERAAEEILTDMADGSHVMNRLLLGDVGTGKTVVAELALASVADTGTQACVMAPTGVLARQYATKCGPLLDAAGISWALLTGATPAAERARTCERLSQGSLTVLFGTQAVLSDDVVFSRLSLVVIDEQHRFGVGQRNALRAKGPGADLLVMTATPIPRTLALSVYGDLETSVIRMRPVAGAGVETKVLDGSSRDLAFGAIREALEQGHQAYVICPLVSEKDGVDELEDVPGEVRDDDGRARAPRLHAAEAELEEVRRALPGATVGLLHGRMSAREKDAAMEAFSEGATQVLVATTVVEVGVDVPNATVMVIEDGERFGLATLHQLRGRVGRGSAPGRCLVLTGSKAVRSPSRERLEALEKTSDGFALAEMDLKLRHEGEILGFRQSGGVSLRFVDFDVDGELIEAAHEDAEELLRHAPTLSSVATLPLRHEVVRRYGDVFSEVSGG